MGRCGCAQGCSCSVIADPLCPAVTVTGNGSAAAPFKICVVGSEVLTNKCVQWTLYDFETPTPRYYLPDGGTLSNLTVSETLTSTGGDSQITARVDGGAGTTFTVIEGDGFSDDSAAIVIPAGSYLTFEAGTVGDDVVVLVVEACFTFDEGGS